MTALSLPVSAGRTWNPPSRRVLRGDRSAAVFVWLKRPRSTITQEVKHNDGSFWANTFSSPGHMAALQAGEGAAKAMKSGCIFPTPWEHELALERDKSCRVIRELRRCHPGGGTADICLIGVWWQQHPFIKSCHLFCLMLQLQSSWWLLG